MSTGSTIKTTVTSTVTLGSAAYLSPLTITRMGGVRVAGFGDTGIYVPAALTGGSILNDGHVYGANGPSVEFFRVDGGIGMDIEGQATALSQQLWHHRRRRRRQQPQHHRSRLGWRRADRPRRFQHHQ